ncbi:hypothetical protein NLJ89_g11699 [Agrocybe chaxingu]|uniref:Plasmid pRiA4b Orf3-like domain-containing protein n=1 Tax=Agrocybe chaxingu TaxID=84603 RepID=A0A9W8JPH6_9AGAR|nr:hypothetical protein NLJ89_g11699 [Agrocybe chaxingu]
MSEIASKKRSRLPEEGTDKENANPTAQGSSSKKQRLHKFKGVYRIVEVPLNYTFANLHTLVQYIFGWQGNHSHRARVYTNVEMYKSLGRENWIKSFGQAPPCPEEWYTERMDEDTRASVRYWFERQHEDAAIYEVVAVGKDTKSRGPFMDYDWHYKVQDHELTLGEIWNEDEDLNFSAGSWKNREIGIVYEYEIGCPWRVDITVEGFGTRENASNGIYFRTAKGAPPVEQKYEWDSDHPDGAKKTISDLLFDSANWKRYCKRQIGTRARRDELVVYVRQKGAMTDEQVKAKQAELEKTAKPIRQQRDKDERQRLKEMRARLKEEREARRVEREEREDYFSGKPEFLFCT